MLGWLVTERIRDGHPTSLGAASGVVAGLVAITPACANVSPVGAVGAPVPARVQAPFWVAVPLRVAVPVNCASVRNTHLLFWSARMMPYLPLTTAVP